MAADPIFIYSNLANRERVRQPVCSRRSAYTNQLTCMGYHRLLQNINVVRLAASVEPAVDGKGREVFQFDDFSGQLHGGALVVGLVIVMGTRKCGAVSILVHTLYA
jgi:hypothetical protein